MKRTLVVALVALAAACSPEKDKTIQWSASQDPTPAQQAAAANATTTLQGSLSYQASTDPNVGAVGLADQLFATFASASASAPGATSAKLAQAVARQAIDTGGIDPACVGMTTDLAGVTTYTWSGCVVDQSSTDPYSGETTTMHVTVDGWLKWDPALRQTSWGIDQSMAMTMPSGPSTTVLSESGRLEGTLAVTDTTIVADTLSAAHVREAVQGPSGTFVVEGDTKTTLTARLQYVASPFCFTGGTLTVTQEADAYGQKQFKGWDLTFTGCGQFQLRRGS